ncbi:Rz-like spanin [Vibrio phage D479]
MKGYAIALIAIILVGCTTTKYVDRYLPADPVTLVHPVVKDPPVDPGLADKVVVITEDTIEPGTAYIGFKYDDWLEFAKYLHDVDGYSDELLEAIKAYKIQDQTLTSEDE